MVIRIEGAKITAALGDTEQGSIALRLTGGEVIKDDNAYRVAWENEREFLAFADVVEVYARSIREEMENDHG